MKVVAVRNPDWGWETTLSAVAAAVAAVTAVAAVAAVTAVAVCPLLAIPVHLME